MRLCHTPRTLLCPTRQLLLCPLPLYGVLRLRPFFRLSPATPLRQFTPTFPSIEFSLFFRSTYGRSSFWWFHRAHLSDYSFSEFPLTLIFPYVNEGSHRFRPLVSSSATHPFPPQLRPIGQFVQKRGGSFVAHRVCFVSAGRGRFATGPFDSPFSFSQKNYATGPATDDLTISPPPQFLFPRGSPSPMSVPPQTW